MRARTASTLLLSAWALFITIVTASNVTELLHTLGIWSPLFRSGNLSFIATATSIYGFSTMMNQALLAGAVVWEGAAAVLLWRAVRASHAGSADAQSSARAGLMVLALLWAAFAIMVEIFIAYDRGLNESMYWTLLTAVLATWLAIEKGPAANATGPGN